MNPLTISKCSTGQGQSQCTSRQEKGYQIAKTYKIERNRLGWKVPSQSGNGSYIVNLDHGSPFCTCQDFEATNKKCKHIFAVEFMLQLKRNNHDVPIPTTPARKIYKQDWRIYNEAQIREYERFPELLSELCKGIAQPVQKGAGRRSHLLSDIIMGVTCKVYSTVSGRRAMKDLRELQARGLVTKALSYNSIFDYLENPALTPLLKSLIEESASPLRAIETDFAVDSSGFATTTYNRWFDHKWGKERSEAKWVKAHLICGVKTHVVTSAEVTATESADAPQFPQLVNATAKTFDINEVSADKAYSSKKNINAVIAVNGTPYIPFKSYSKGSQGMHIFDGLWQRMWHYYTFNREAFLVHYHKRSNAETALSMIKMKFGAMVRAKTPVAQVNEVLCKILCHNICVIIQSIYELGLEPTFWNCRAERAVARQLSMFN